jgi:hypothetical protein
MRAASFGIAVSMAKEISRRRITSELSEFLLRKAALSKPARTSSGILNVKGTSFCRNVRNLPAISATR